MKLNVEYLAALLHTHHHTDGFIEALSCGCAPQDGLSYRDEHIRVDVESISPEHRASLDLFRDTTDYNVSKSNITPAHQ